MPPPVPLPAVRAAVVVGLVALPAFVVSSQPATEPGHRPEAEAVQADRPPHVDGRLDGAGVKPEVPMDEWVEVRAFGVAEEGGGELNRPLYQRRRRSRSGEQTVTVTVPSEPARAGADPRPLLIDTEHDNNVVDVQRGLHVEPRRQR